MQQVQERPASVSTPLPGATVYRPGGVIAVVLVFVPVVMVAAAAGAFMLIGDTIPLWVPAAALAWVLGVPLWWLSLKTVRVDAFGIEAGRPWQVLRAIPWEIVAKMERRGPRLRVTGRDFTRISFNPGLLHNGADLRESLLLRLPIELLDDALRDEARGVAIVTSGRTNVGQLPGMFRLRPRPALRLLAGLVTLAALGGAPVAILFLPLDTGLAVAAVCVAAVGSGLWASHWLWQQIKLSDAGITVIAPLSGRARSMPWADVVLLEYTPKGSSLRVTSGREKDRGKGAQSTVAQRPPASTTARTKDERVASPGPRVMRSLDATIYRAYLVRQLLDRHVMEAVRNWIP